MDEALIAGFFSFSIDVIAYRESTQGVAVNDLGNIVFVLAVIWVIYYGGNNMLRVSDLIAQLESTLVELARDEYTVTYDTQNGMETIELTNPTSRIQYSCSGNKEGLVISLFFNDKEKSGANKTQVTRHKAERRSTTQITYGRENRLMGRLLYFQQGVSRLPRVHQSMDRMIATIFAYQAKTQTKTPQ